MLKALLILQRMRGYLGVILLREEALTLTIQKKWVVGTNTRDGLTYAIAVIQRLLLRTSKCGWK